MGTAGCHHTSRPPPILSLPVLDPTPQLKPVLETPPLCPPQGTSPTPLAPPPTGEHALSQGRPIGPRHTGVSSTSNRKTSPLTLPPSLRRLARLARSLRPSFSPHLVPLGAALCSTCPVGGGGALALGQKGLAGRGAALPQNAQHTAHALSQAPPASQPHPPHSWVSSPNSLGRHRCSSPAASSGGTRGS